MYFIYILRCYDQSLYIGITKDIKRRMQEHCLKKNKAAKYTKSHSVKNMEALWICKNRSFASSLEYWLKTLSKSKKELIIQNNEYLSQFLSHKIDINQYQRVGGIDMKTVTLGRTKITVNKNGFGALPVQRVSLEEAKVILQKAYHNGIQFYDTARAYSDSEQKLGYALHDVRNDIIIATKTMAKTVDEFWEDLHMSLEMLQTNYIDIYQFHNPSFCPKPQDGTGLYEAMLEAQSQGIIRFIGLTNHKVGIAKEAALSGLYDTIQFPFNYLSSQQDEELVQVCQKHNVGFICMKAMSGGLITRSDAAYAYLNQFDHVLPIWGIQKEKELDEFISYQKRTPMLTDDIQAIIEHDRQELAGEFCRGCGYCMPCPQGIVINQCARMSLMLRRAPQNAWLSKKWQEEMKKIETCLHCGKCMQHCPYHLNIPEVLKKNYEDYQTFL